MMTQESTRYPQGRHHRGTAGAWLIVVAALIAYGSCLPFHFERNAEGAIAVDAARIALLPATSRADIWVNLVLYVPIGLMAGAFVASRSGGAARVAAGLACGVMLSVSVEWVQTAIPERVASWLDVALNTLGAAAGALAWPAVVAGARAVQQCFRREWVRRPLMAAAVILSCAVLLIGILPFDFVRSTAQLHEAFLRADWSLVPRLNAGWAGALIHEGADAAWFAVIGYCVAVARRRQDWPHGDAFFSAAKHGVVVACVLTAVQLLCAHHVFALSELAVRTVAALAGAAAGGGLRISPIPSPRMAFVALGMIVGTDWIIESTGSFAFFAAAEGQNRLSAIPFETLWRTSLSHAALEGANAVLVFAAISCAIRLWFAHWPSVRAWTVAIALSVGLSLATELAQLTVAGKTADLTQPVLALMTGLLLAWLGRRLNLGLSATLSAASAGVAPAEPRGAPVAIRIAD